jgi:uncharacterized membrane protein YeiH
VEVNASAAVHIASSHGTRRKCVSFGPQTMGKVRRPIASACALVKPLSSPMLSRRRSASVMVLPMSAACAWTDFLQTSGKWPASFTIPPCWPPIPSAHVLQALLLRRRLYSATVPTERPFASTYFIAANPPAAFTRGVTIVETLTLVRQSMSVDFLPDLATKTPLWLALLTVGVNALVGALRASIDDDHVGMATFAVLMGLGGGFIRDGLIGNLPVESLRTPWYLLTVLGAIIATLVLGEVLSKVSVLVSTLNALALGLFSVIGAAYALRAELPVVAAIFVGTVSAVGGGVLVSVMKDEVPQILLASAPNALVSTLSSGVYVAVEVSNTRAAAVAGVATAIVAHFMTERLGLTSRRATGPSALLLTRSKKP